MQGHLPISCRIIKDRKANPWQQISSSVVPSRTFRGNYRNWDEVSMLKAIEAVTKQRVSVRKASELYGVPKSTLSDKVLGKVPVKCRSGPSSYLTFEEEEELTSFILEMAKIGYALTRKEVICIVQRIVDSKDISTNVSNGWWERYVQRHPHIRLRAAVPLSLARAMASDRDVLNRYFDMLEDCLRSNEILNRPSCIFNCDETGVPLNPQSLKVVTEKGAKHPSYISSGCKIQVTVMACTCAAGYAIPPLVIFDRLTLNEAMTKGEVPGTVYGLSSNGWITREIFNGWFEHFLCSIPSVRPVILMLDGHSSHYCPETIRMAAENQIIMCTVPPNTTHLTQPLDIGCFSPFKANWRQLCHQFCSQNPGRTVSRYDFCELFAQAWFKSFTSQNIINSFKATGICPFDRHAIQLPEDDNEFDVFKPQSLAERTKLAYIPLYSPACPRPTKVQFKLDDSFSSTFSCSPKKLDSSCNGSFLFSTPLSHARYSKSEPSLLDDSIFESQPLPCASTISKFLIRPDPPSKISTKRGKSAGVVLTSRQKINELEQKEKEKQMKAFLKEERKQLREAKKNSSKIKTTYARRIVVKKGFESSDVKDSDSG